MRQRLILVLFSSALVMLGWTASADAQQRQGQRPPRNPRSVRGVLGGVEMTAADSAVKAIVDRLDFDSYKEILHGLTRFGDREQGTERAVLISSAASTRAISITSAVPEPSSFAASPPPRPSMCAPMMYISLGIVLPIRVAYTSSRGCATESPRGVYS